MAYSIDTEKYKHICINGLKRHGFPCDLDNPTTIQEKLMWLNVYDTNPLKVMCADKIKVHEYCKEKLGEDICVPIIKTYDKVEDINWGELPQQFVIKCNHGSGMNIIVKDKKKLDVQDSIKRLKFWMGDDFTFRNGFEAHYHDIPHKIFVEKYMNDGNETLYDYKFWCFNGKPKIYTINDGNGHGKWMTFYDMNQNMLPYKRVDFRGEPPSNIQQPSQFSLMEKYGEILSKDFMFVRVDFYEIGGKVYLGELTFTLGVCLFKYSDEKYDKEVGKMLKL